jgi:hypothetical protein
MATRARPTVLALGASALLSVAALGMVFMAQGESWMARRTRTIPVSGEVLHRHLDDLERFVVWQPRQAADDPPTFTFSTPAVGVGAWVEAKRATSKTTTHLVSIDANRVRYSFENEGQLGTGRSEVEVLLRPAPSGTEVEYVFTGKLAGWARLFWPVFRPRLRKQLGESLEAALAELERQATR